MRNVAIFSMVLSMLIQVSSVIYISKYGSKSILSKLLDIPNISDSSKIPIILIIILLSIYDISIFKRNKIAAIERGYDGGKIDQIKIIQSIGVASTVLAIAFI